MKRSEDIQLAHNALQNVNLKKVTELINSVNLTAIEKEIVISSELKGLRIKEILDQYSLSQDSIMRIKTAAMRKIAAYIQQINNR